MDSLLLCGNHVPRLLMYRDLFIIISMFVRGTSVHDWARVIKKTFNALLYFSQFMEKSKRIVAVYIDCVQMFNLNLTHK